MDRHHPDDVFRACRNAAALQIGPARKKTVKIPQKCGEPAAAVFLEGARVGDQRTEIRFFLRAARRHLHQSEKIRLPVDPADQLFRCIHCRAEPHGFQKIQKAANLLQQRRIGLRFSAFRILLHFVHRAEQLALSVVQPHRDQLIEREADHRGEHCRGDRNLQQRIVHCTQNIQQQHDFRRLQIALLLRRPHRDAPCLERVCVCRKARAVAHQNQEIPRLARPQTAVLPAHGCSVAQMKSDPLRDVFRRIRCRNTLLRHHDKFRGTPRLGIIRAAHQRLCFIVADFTDPLGHQLTEHMVDDVHNLLRTPEIPVQVDAGVLRQLRAVIGRALLHGVIKVLRVCVAEAVNALLAVTDHKQIVAVFLGAAAP